MTASNALDTFGDAGRLVSDFLVEVRGRDVDWSAVVARAKQESTRQALHAISKVRWPVPFLGAVDKAARLTYGSLGLTRDDFTNPLDLGGVKIGISGASKAIAAGGKLAAEHRRVLLVPFVEAGFVSAAEALRVLDGVEVPGGGSVVEE
jgi:hypothetical protein